MPLVSDSLEKVLLVLSLLLQDQTSHTKCNSSFVGWSATVFLFLSPHFFFLVQCIYHYFSNNVIACIDPLNAYGLKLFPSGTSARLCKQWSINNHHKALCIPLLVTLLGNWRIRVLKDLAKVTQGVGRWLFKSQIPLSDFRPHVLYISMLIFHAEYREQSCHSDSPGQWLILYKFKAFWSQMSEKEKYDGCFKREKADVGRM